MIFMYAALIIPVFCGWLAGLTINYLSDVLPQTRRFTRPACPACGETITTWDYMSLRRCRNGHARGVRAWVVQLASLMGSLNIWLQPPGNLGFVIGLILAVYFAVVFIIDLEHRLILHPTSIFGAVLGFIIGFLQHGFLPTLVGGLAGLGLMLSFYYMGVIFSRFRARRMRASGKETDDEEALGAGDVILVTILGLMLGWPLIWFGLLFGILLGGAISLIIVLWLVISRRYGENALMLFIPYGPYFITSAALIIYFPASLANILPG
jgi:prepilin signal peptidase PulO-like enzyme (type II secretory pathway)